MVHPHEEITRKRKERKNLTLCSKTADDSAITDGFQIDSGKRSWQTLRYFLISGRDTVSSVICKIIKPKNVGIGWKYPGAHGQSRTKSDVTF